MIKVKLKVWLLLRKGFAKKLQFYVLFNGFPEGFDKFFCSLTTAEEKSDFKGNFILQFTFNIRILL